MPIFVACRGRPFCRFGHAGKNKYDLGKTTRHLVEITKHLDTNCRLPDFAEKARYPARSGDKAKEEAADVRLPPFGLLQRYDIFRRKANRPLRVLTFGRAEVASGKDRWEQAGPDKDSCRCRTKISPQKSYL